MACTRRKILYKGGGPGLAFALKGAWSGPKPGESEDVMSTRADELIDRRRLRRKLTFWRIVAFAVIVLAIAFATRQIMGSAVDVSANHIAQVKISGTIFEEIKNVRMAAPSLKRTDTRSETR